MRIPPLSVNKAAHSGFEKDTLEVQNTPHKKNLCSPKNLKKKNLKNHHHLCDLFYRE